MQDDLSNVKRKNEEELFFSYFLASHFFLLDIYVIIANSYLLLCAN